MNFHCERCGQKYKVADEKLQGRETVRFRCPKCENVIPVKQSTSVRPSAPAGIAPPRAPTAPRAPRAEAPGPRPMTVASPAPRAQSAFLAPRASVRAAEAPTVARAAIAEPVVVSPPLPSTAALLDASETDWYAGIRDLPVGPLTRKELAARAAAGDLDASTLVWREGMTDWLPVRDVAALRSIAPVAKLVRPEPPAAPIVQPAPIDDSVASPPEPEELLGFQPVADAPLPALEAAETAVVSAPEPVARLAPEPLPVVSSTPARERSALWIALPAVLLVGGVGAFGITRFLSRPVAPVAAASEAERAVSAPPSPAPAALRPVVVAPRLAPTPAIEPAETPRPTATTEVVERRPSRRGHDPSPRAPMGFSARDRAMLGLGVSASPPPAPVAGANAMRLARPPTAEEPAREREAPFSVRLAVGNAMQRSGIVRQCWDQQQRLDPGVQPSRIHVTATVDANGRITGANASDAEAWMGTCIRRNARSIVGAFPGGPFSVTTPFDLSR